MAVATGAIGPLGLAISLVPLALAWYAYRLYVAEADQARRRNEELQLIRAMLGATPDLMLRLNRNGDVLGGNVDHAGVLPGPPGPTGRNVRDLLPANIVDPTLHYIGRTLDAGAMQIYEYQLATERGQGDFEARLVVSGENEVLAIVRDNTERKALERQLAHQAFHDALTGLPNRTLFMDRLQHAVARSSRTGATLAVLFLDLDRFKVVNDSLGHDVGDQLLIAVAAHLTRTVRASDTVARLGGDEFTILLEDVDAGIARRVAERIMATLQAPFVLAGHEVCVTTSIGIALNNEGPATADELMRDSDAAMYRGKSRGKARYEVFDASMHVRSLERLRLESELRHAIERGELSVHYQPTVSLVDGRVTGLEALVRWRHPERGLISPGVFVPVAEETGLILPLGRWVLAEACRQAKAWQIQHPSTPFTISVNLSVRQFQHPGLVDDVASVLQTVGLAPETLVLEITEGIVIETAEANSRVLEQLKGLGVRLAIDDFGTGYSNLSYLTRFPVDVLKIDRSFVDGLGHDRGDSAIVHTVISLARTLGLGVTAEGIETAEQLQLLRAAGCDSGQGFYFSRPVPDVEAERLIAAGRCEIDPKLALAG
jgi:diguanylate cyclase (GGDEF)-like protein